MKRILYLAAAIMAVCVMLLAPVKATAADDFPIRAKFPKVPYITLEQLRAEYDKIIIIDVRSTFEYNVIHTNKAKHVSVTKTTFLEDLAAVRGKEDTTPMTFYYNGHKCEKSYDATQKALDAGFKNVTVFDSGIFDWANAYPELTTLMGKTPADKTVIIPQEEFNKRFLPYEEIKAKASDINSVVIDIREPLQRELIPNIPSLRSIPLDRLLPLLQKGEFKNNNLYFIDAVGKQVEWLQYHLEANGYKNYNFSQGGVTGTKDFK